MKTALQISMTLLVLATGVIAFAGLIGIGSFSAFFGSEAAITVYSMAGLMLIGFSDSARRPIAPRVHIGHARPVAVRRTVAAACVACPAA